MGGSRKPRARGYDGPAGVVGAGRRDPWPQSFLRDHPDLARQLATLGRHPRAGHDRGSWRREDWRRYRAQVSPGRRLGPWSVEKVWCFDESLSAWIARAEAMPHVSGSFTALRHVERGLVMSDLPAELAGCLPVLRRAHGRVLVNGLGLGIVAAHVLAKASVERVDVVELDPAVAELVLEDDLAARLWSKDPRLHVRIGDAHDIAWPAGTCWDVAWHDIWDQVSPENLPSMVRLHRRYGRRAGWQGSWERPECEAMLRRGQVLRRPALGCALAEWA